MAKRGRKKEAEVEVVDEEEGEGTSSEAAEVPVLDADARQDINHFFPDDLQLHLNAQEVSRLPSYSSEVGSLFDCGDKDTDEDTDEDEDDSESVDEDAPL